MTRSWQIKDTDTDAALGLSRGIRCHPLIGSLLIQRGITTAAAATAFFHPSLASLANPFDLADMGTAVQRVTQALVNKENILVFGDYDTDGVCATAILVGFLRQAGADPLWHLPHRITEGYGLAPGHIDQVALPGGIGLVITADCGSASHEAIALAKSRGIDVIVTDHHQVSPPLAPALALVNPQRPDCDSGLTHLSGSGVAFFLVLALRKHLRELGFWNHGAEPNLKNHCDLVAIGTIADMVPLTADNRILARAGLEVLCQAPKPWLQALRQDGTLSDPMITSRDVAFRLAPRLNASGRLDHAGNSLNFLLAQDLATSLPLAALLNRLNSRRQDLEKAIWDDINNLIRTHPGLEREPTLVMADPFWHEGVLGIAAGRLAKQMGKPVVLISTKSGMGKGSARSVAGIDLFRAMTMSADFIQRYGGHEMAAGLTLEPAMIPGFAQTFSKAVVFLRGTTTPAPDPVLVDGCLQPAAISEALVNELEWLEPFGVGNPEPVFMAEGVKVDHFRRMGNAHWQLRLSGGSAAPVLEAVWFNPPAAKPPARFKRIAFHLGRNRWNGKNAIRLFIQAGEP